MDEGGANRNTLRPNGKYLFFLNEKLEDAGPNVLKTGRFNLIINIIIIVRHELGLDRLVSASRETVKTVFFIVVPCILITSEFLLPTNAPFIKHIRC